mmetsp:Transcript_11338/g.15832  ORF Transcript_11338/g.15832 Transcript_11338/m.15832 type:complete len:240 (-) Transcript_11338:175-894(-)|eukprot:CAMPEP_0184498028 /NCGR_PEP_ID=MMETSP0113_2-20130426/37983_1 /TAXON_ID=91329 /ORGANISM="Norrisiella sphaerica, Strain BC52" /LENGTH=239 /DNA_ID=CAMNT_0026885379 /DNA_START=65 /DNA_END=784 /DNA_ORIENTATION=-
MSRGRPDCFSWDDVKIDKHRENYLGHSQFAPVGRWQKGKDILWYTRGKKNSDDAEAAERAKVRAQDRQAIMERLGLATKKRKVQNRLSKSEMKELLRKGDIERDDNQAAERIDGLGASSSRYHEGRTKADKVEKLKEMIASGMKRVQDAEDEEGESGDFTKPKTKLSAAKMLEMAKAALAKAEAADDSDDEEARKAFKKAKKAAKKAKRKAKKEAKRAKKAKKRGTKRRHRSDDSDDSD